MRFLDMPARRREEELAEVLEEVAAGMLAKAAEPRFGTLSQVQEVVCGCCAGYSVVVLSRAARLLPEQLKPATLSIPLGSTCCSARCTKILSGNSGGHGSNETKGLPGCFQGGRGSAFIQPPCCGYARLT